MKRMMMIKCILHILKETEMRPKIITIQILVEDTGSKEHMGLEDWKFGGVHLMAIKTN